MDMENMNNVGSQAKGACKKYWKKGLAAVVALALLGGAGAAWDIQREHSERAAKDAARSQLVAAQAAREDITLISEDEAKAKAAEAVGMDESALTFDRVGLENLAQQKDGGKDKKEKNERKDGDKKAFTALHENHDNRGHGNENHDGDEHDRYEHDGDHRMMQQGMGQPGMPGAPQPMMQGAPQGQPPMMDGQQQPQGAPMAQAAQNTDGTQPQPPMQPQAAAQGESDSAATQTQNQRPHFGFHPAYKVACEHNGVKYHVLVDATNGNVMMCDVA